MTGTCAGAAALLLLVAAARPAALAETSPGLWEIERPPECAKLRSANAWPTRRRSPPSSIAARPASRSWSAIPPSTTVIDYTCANGGFGHSKLTLLTPRSLRIETQGISANYPFNYVIQARRVGECTVSLSGRLTRLS